MILRCAPEKIIYPPEPVRTNTRSARKMHILTQVKPIRTTHKARDPKIPVFSRSLFPARPSSELVREPRVETHGPHISVTN